MGHWRTSFMDKWANWPWSKMLLANRDLAYSICSLACRKQYYVTGAHKNPSYHLLSQRKCLVQMEPGCCPTNCQTVRNFFEEWHRIIRWQYPIVRCQVSSLWLCQTRRKCFWEHCQNWGNVFNKFVTQRHFFLRSWRHSWWTWGDFEGFYLAPHLRDELMQTPPPSDGNWWQIEHNRIRRGHSENRQFPE